MEGSFEEGAESSNSQHSTLNYQLSTVPLLSAPMKCPEKVASHHVGDDREQHQENRDPENPAMVHSPPTRRTISVVLVTMVLIVHAKERKHITGPGIVGKEKGPSRTGASEPDWRFRAGLAVPGSARRVFDRTDSS
jgi:hypothetical protein